MITSNWISSNHGKYEYENSKFFRSERERERERERESESECER